MGVILGTHPPSFLGALRILTPPMVTPGPPNHTPGASKQVVLTPRDIPRILRVGNFFSFIPKLQMAPGHQAAICQGCCKGPFRGDDVPHGVAHAVAHAMRNATQTWRNAGAVATQNGITPGNDLGFDPIFQIDGNEQPKVPFFFKASGMAGFKRGFKLMEIKIATAVFQVPY